MTATTLLLPLLMQVALAPAPVEKQTSPLVYWDNYGPGQTPDCAGEPTGSPCWETIMGVYYPTGVGPAGLGHPTDPRPVMIVLRGADNNAPFPEELDFFQTNILPHGWIGVDPNYPEVCSAEESLAHGAPLPPECVGTGLDYNVSVDGVAYLVQYLRAHAGFYNIDPDAIFVFGRSFGGNVAYALALKQDYQDLASRDAVQHESSRPTAIVPFSSPAALNCSPGFDNFNSLMTIFFPVGSANSATLQQKLDDSAWWWLENPQLFGRTETPPMFLGYTLGYTQGCGNQQDPHDGLSGLVMKNTMDRFVETTGDPLLGNETVLWDSNDFYAFYDPTWVVIMAWAEKVRAADFPGLYLFPVGGPVTNELAIKEWRVLGGTFGSGAWFYIGFTNLASPIPIPFCPNLTLDMGEYFFAGPGAFDTTGKASLSFQIPPQSAGIKFKLQAYDWVNCTQSNVCDNWISTVL